MRQEPQLLVLRYRKLDHIRNLWNQSIQKWGNVDIWINNAGINSTHDFTWEIEYEDTKLTIISQDKKARNQE